MAPQIALRNQYSIYLINLKSSRMNRTNTIITSLTLATLVISILLQLTMYVGWDIGWRLHITNELLSGGNYLTSFIDINPPILMYEYVPAILIAKAHQLERNHITTTNHLCSRTHITLALL